MADETGRRVRLELAPEPQAAGTGRLFAAATARHFGYLEDTVEDIKLAISEAVTHFLDRSAVDGGQDEAAERIRIAILPTADSIAFEISGPSRRGSLDQMTLTVIESLFGTATLAPHSSSSPDRDGRAPEGATLRFAVERPAFKDEGQS